VRLANPKLPTTGLLLLLLATSNLLRAAGYVWLAVDFAWLPSATLSVVFLLRLGSADANGLLSRLLSTTWAPLIAGLFTAVLVSLLREAEERG